ncbi:CCAAT-binding factor complex subunit HapC [Aspergillus flavus]|uniref:CCAAT-binding factor complex subunit HapC n=1 Tax=Aspergillus arachidicola TaxID=656916 RepID=A0A2G7G3F2_9EURO|nr:CCAAT-binding factor complex subunit HapC [Aspergillus arachidicola]RAQ63586.1 CCAAT-binding factor complex subunit HapC [Aspergillus flavus]RAQ80960.1 CCAAT-binding factor complex subunit HapC [Aspergillus flavus]
MSSTSPSKEPEVEPEVQSGEEQEQMDKEQQDQAQNQGEFEVKEQDRWLPIANVARIMKLALPDNAKIAKEAKECMQECVSEFISFITSEASEKCQQEKRKTVNGEDILFAMTSLGFENYAEALKIYLSKYREVRPVQRSEFPALPPAVGSVLGQDTQSARGEHQNRPTSSGYASGGPVGGVSSAPGGRPATAGGFPDAADNTNSIMNPSLDPTEQDPSAYGYPPMVGQPHNGTAGDSY